MDNNLPNRQSSTRMGGLMDQAATAAGISADAEWGVLHSAHSAGRIVDVRPDEAAARSWRACLRFCGNDDAELVARADSHGAWIPVGESL